MASISCHKFCDKVEESTARMQLYVNRFADTLKTANERQALQANAILWTMNNVRVFSEGIKSELDTADFHSECSKLLLKNVNELQPATLLNVL